MKAYRVLVLLVLCFLASSLSAQAEGTDLVRSQLASAFQGKNKLTVAVSAFVNADGKQSALGRYFADESTKYLLKRPGVQVVERSQVHQLEQEWDLSSSGLVAEDQAVEIGGILGADAIVLGTLTRSGRHIMVRMRIVDTRTGAILSTGSAELSGSKFIRMYHEILE